MSISAILSAINADVSKHKDENLFTFTNFAPVSAICSREKEEQLKNFGILREEYVNVCRWIYTLYIDTVHWAYYKEQDLMKEKIIRGYFHEDLRTLVTVILGDGFKVCEIFTNTQITRDFEERCISIVQKSNPNITDDIQIAGLDEFTKYIEKFFSYNATGIAMLSAEERKRRIDLRQIERKIQRLNKSLENAVSKEEEAKKMLTIFQLEGDEKQIEKQKRLLFNSEKELSEIRESLYNAVQKRKMLEKTIDKI